VAKEKEIDRVYNQMAEKTKKTNPEAYKRYQAYLENPLNFSLCVWHDDGWHTTRKKQFE
jgi:hypothetical protein